MKIEADKRYVRRDGNISGPIERITNILYPWKCSDTDCAYDAEGYYYSFDDPCDLDLIAPYEDEPEQKERVMKFKVGDRVKFNMIITGVDGVGKVVRVDAGCAAIPPLPYYIRDDNDFNWWWCREDELELVEAAKEPAQKEPIPGKFYRTRGGLKLLYVGMGNLDKFVYQEEGGYFKNYVLPFNYFDDCSESAGDIVGEWTEETKLPAVEIKRWAVVNKDGSDVFAGLFRSKTKADVMLSTLDKSEQYEIVELIGTLPERKLT